MGERPSIIVRPPQIDRTAVTWPTVLLFFVVTAWVSINAYLAFFSGLDILTWPFGIYFAFSGAAIMVLNFSVAHEASHRNITRSRFWNDVLGHISIFWMHGGFYHFRTVHLAHHAHPNDPEQDPDIHANMKPGLKAFFVWSLSLIQYVAFLFKRNKAYNGVGSILPYGLMAAAYVFAYQKGFLAEMLLCWTLPSFTGTALVVFIFDYLPHVPHKETYKYRTARIFEASPFVSFLMQGHNYHLIHHLWPSIPWYKYGEAYRAKKEELLEVDAAIEAKA